jgi:hypothetical protein
VESSSDKFRKKESSRGQCQWNKIVSESTILGITIVLRLLNCKTVAKDSAGLQLGDQTSSLEKAWSGTSGNLDASLHDGLVRDADDCQRNAQELRVMGIHPIIRTIIKIKTA